MGAPGLAEVARLGDFVLEVGQNGVSFRRYASCLEVSSVYDSLAFRALCFHVSQVLRPFDKLRAGYGALPFISLHEALRFHQNGWFKSSGADRHHQNICIVDLNWAFFSIQVPTEAAPTPLFGRRDQPSLDRIAVNVPKLLDSFLLCPNVEVVEPSQPERMRN